MLAAPHSTPSAITPPAPRRAYETDAAGRIPCLDGLRAIASWMVLFYHFTRRIAPTTGDFAFLHSVPYVLWEGVDLFFVLSGFLIAGILFDVRNSPRYFSTFYWRRAFRILPVHYLGVLSYSIALLLLPASFVASAEMFMDPISVWAYIAHVQNFFMAWQGNFGPTWLAAYWSLAVEEQFYLLLPFLVRRFSPRTIFKGCIAAAVFSMLLRASIHKWKWLPGISATVLLPSRMDGLALGAIAAYLCRYQVDWLLSVRRRLPWLAVGTLVAMLLFDFFSGDRWIRYNFARHFSLSIIFTLCLLALVTHPESRPAKWLSTRFMHVFGNYSYSAYLYHPPILGMVFYFFGARDPILNSGTDLALVTLAVPLTYLASALSWRFVETPLLRRGRALSY